MIDLEYSFKQRWLMVLFISHAVVASLYLAIGLGMRSLCLMACVLPSFSAIMLVTRELFRLMGRERGKPMFVVSMLTWGVLLLSGWEVGQLALERGISGVRAPEFSWWGIGGMGVVFLLYVMIYLVRGQLDVSRISRGVKSRKWGFWMGAGMVLFSVGSLVSPAVGWHRTDAVSSLIIVLSGIIHGYFILIDPWVPQGRNSRLG